MSLSKAFFKSCLGNDFWKSAKDRALKVCIDVGVYDSQDVILKAVGPGSTSAVVVNDSDEFHCLLHTVDLNRALGSDVKLINAVLILKRKFSIPYPYYFHCTSIDDVQKTLPEMSK